jgi:anti-sigma-K factor RskA
MIPRLLYGRMESPERLAGDQRAVLQLVLGQGRSYGEIAGMLAIAPDEVRARALAALDALGPPTTVPDADRARIADYVLGQLPASDSDRVRDALADSPAQRAWARVVSAELGPLASSPLPPIPDRPATPAPTRVGRNDAGAETVATAGNGEPLDPTAPAPPRSSRTGGIVLLSVLAAAIIAAIVIFVIKPGGGSGKHHDPSGAVARVSSSHSATSSSSSSQTTSSSQTAAIVGQINLTPPTGGGKTKGVALVLQQGSLKGLGIEAEHVPTTTTKPRTTYAVWLYNSASDARLLGYFSKGVNKKGDLGSTAELPTNAAHYKYLIITLETGDKTSRRPGPVVLKGDLSAVAKSKL